MELFHRVTTSMISLCDAISSIFCFSVRTAVAVALRWKKATTFLTRPSKATDARKHLNLLATQRFNVCAKHLICGNYPASLTDTSMLRALSVTTAVLWGAFSSSHSCIAAFKTSAMLVPVCDSKAGESEAQTWLRPCCSKTALYRCLAFFQPFCRREFAEVCCCDVVLNGTSYSKCLTSCMAALFLQFLQTVLCFVCNFFTIVVSRDRKTKMLPHVRLIRRRGIFNFSFPRIHVALLMFSSSDFCNCDEAHATLLQRELVTSAAQPIGLDCRHIVKVSPPLYDAYRNIFASRNIVLWYIVTPLVIRHDWNFK